MRSRLSRYIVLGVGGVGFAGTYREERSRDFPITSCRVVWVFWQVVVHDKTTGSEFPGSFYWRSGVEVRAWISVHLEGLPVKLSDRVTPREGGDVR